MKLRRKLLAAGFAFGATALTLTTSTFAWYTANNKVELGQVNGATASSASSDSLYVAAATAYVKESSASYAAPGASVDTTTTYGTSQSVTYVGNNEANKRVLAPVAYTAANTYQKLTGATEYSGTKYATEEAYNLASSTLYTLSGTTYTAVTSDTTYSSTETYYTKAAKPSYPVYETDTTGVCVYEFVLRFQKPNATASANVYVSKFDLTNTATSATSAQQALTYDATTASTVGIGEGGLYNVDMLHALKMTVAATPMLSTGAVDTTATTTRKVYDLDGFADTSKDSTNMATTVNALGYYNAVLGTALSTPDNYLVASATASDNTHIDGTACIGSTDAATGNSSNSVLFTIPATGFVEVRFTFWLDGWDSFCYDVCQKQNFNLDMAFSTEPAKSVLTTFTAATGKAASSGSGN